MRTIDREIYRLRIEKLEAQAKLYESRLTILECDHDYVPEAIIRSREYYRPATGNTMGGMYCTSYEAYRLKCSKCGHVLKEISEREYLELKLERSKTACAAERDELKAKLKELDEEKSDA